MTVKKEDKKHKFSFMLSHVFNQEGKIEGELVYVSSNHLEKF